MVAAKGLQVGAGTEQKSRLKTQASSRSFLAESEAAMERQIQMFAWLPYISNKSAPHISIPSMRYGKLLALLYCPHKRDDAVHNLLIVVQPSTTKVCLSRMSINAVSDSSLSLCSLRVQCGRKTFTLTQVFKFYTCLVFCHSHSLR